MKPITYLSEQAIDYTAAITTADTLAKLKAVTADFKEVASDAHAIVETMTKKEFDGWRKGLYLERHGRFGGEMFARAYGALLMPEILFRVQMIAGEFKVPWGCAYIRLKETGKLKEMLAK